MATVAEILAYTLLDNTVQDYLIALAVLIGSVIVLRFFKFVIVHELKKIFTKTKTKVDDLIIEIVDIIRWPFYLLLSLFISLRFIQVPAIINTVLYYIIFIAATYYGVKAVQRIIDFGTEKVIEVQKKEEKEIDTSVIDLLNKILKSVLWIIAALLILSILGYNITPMLAGLGIGGIAIAFAMQNVLTDIFASFSIYFDKPFKKGDFIIIGSDLGVVKHIGIKSTRIQTLQGQELVVSNKELTETRINNYKKMEKRRIAFSIGVTYETPTNKLKKIPSIIKGVIDKIELAKVDRVHFNKFGDFSLNYETIYYIDTSDYNKYMDIQQEINLAIKEQFEKEGIEFAYPTQTIFLNK